jgi:ethanolamine utilization protein EutP (predicted NTPase)
MSKEIVPIERIARSILYLRGQKVILDRDLAILYGVETRIVNQAVKRNATRFPADFMFALTTEEIAMVSQTVIPLSDGERSRSQIVILKRGQNIKYRPYAFTEQGVAMLSSVLNSERAVKVNIAIMRAFVKLRETLETNRELARKFAELERRVGERTRLACWRWRPRHRELFLNRATFASDIPLRRSFSARRRKGHARRVCSPTRKRR